MSLGRWKTTPIEWEVVFNGEVIGWVAKPYRRGRRWEWTPNSAGSGERAEDKAAAIKALKEYWRPVHLRAAQGESP